MNGLDRTGECQSKKYVKIEPCLHEEVSYTILSNTLHAVCCHHCLQVSSGQHSFDENNQCVCGYGLPDHTVTIYQASENGNGTYKEGVSYIVAENHDFYLPDNEVAISNLCFEGWMIGTPTQVNGYEVTGGRNPLCPGRHSHRHFQRLVHRPLQELLERHWLWLRKQSFLDCHHCRPHPTVRSRECRRELRRQVFPLGQRPRV